MKKTSAIILSLVLTALTIAPFFDVQFMKADAATANELSLNQSFEQQGTDANSAYNWNVFQNGYTRTPETAHSGSYSIKLSNAANTMQSGAYQRIDLKQTSVQPVFVGGYVKGSNISMASGSFFGASIYAEIHLTDGSVMYWNSVPNTGTFDWRWVGFNTGSGFTTATGLIPVTKPIDYILVVPILGNASGEAYFDDISVQQFSPTQSAVTLMFDDGYASDFTQAKPAMDKYGFVGSTAIITNNIGQENFMNLDQIKSLATSGWEIVSHTVSHSDLGTLSSAQQDDELRSSQSTLASQGFSVKNIAYPFGAYTGETVGITQKYYASGRSFEDGYNPQGVFPYQVKVQKLINTTTVADVQNWINHAKANNEWLVIVAHAIDTTGDDQFYIAPSTFSSIIDAVAASNMPVITYQKGIEQFAVSQGIATPVTPTTGWNYTGSANLNGVNQPGTVTLNIANSGSASNVVVDVEIYDAANQRVFQSAYPNQNFSTNVPVAYSANWTPNAAGNYVVKFGIFSNDWSTLHFWQNAALALTVGGTTTTPTTPTTTPPTTGSIDTWWPIESSVISGTQPFKALVQNMDLSLYTMYWQVDGDRLNEMANSTQDYPHKQSDVDVSGWNWKNNGPYAITFVAKNLLGSIIAQKTVNITVTH